VLAREAVLNDSEVATLLATRFVAYALDNVEHPQLTAAEREFLQDKGLKFCTQGMSAFTADGRLLATGGGFEPGPVRQMLRQALARFTPGPAELDLPQPTEPERARLLRPPEGGLVLTVTWKVLGGTDRPESAAATGHGAYDRAMANALGVDRLWVRADEAAALARGDFPESLQRRIGRHVSYVCVGTVKEAHLTLRDGRLEGRYVADTGDRADVLGFVAARGGKVTRFDLVIKGLGERVEDCGFAAGLTVVPRGRKVPVGLAFCLADPDDELARVPPHYARDERYLR
jgi:hypothetical protein